jgi:hypothetical protein
MSGLFSSPGKQAQQGASGSQAAGQPVLNQLQNYVTTSDQQQRAVIEGEQNPFLNALASNRPQAINPGDTATFYTPGGPGVPSPVAQPKPPPRAPYAPRSVASVPKQPMPPPPPGSK